ncbi:hypothetical protein FRC18_007367 [Serendipita sp. 400]|nr:hypothetical protein FRC18_007367 [Serendipita sp. 400]
MPGLFPVIRGWLTVARMTEAMEREGVALQELTKEGPFQKVLILPYVPATVTTLPPSSVIDALVLSSVTPFPFRK